MNILHARWGYASLILFLLVGSHLLPFSSVVEGQSTTLDVVQNTPFIDFPRAIDFSLIANADTPIVVAELTYGVDALTCDNVSFGETLSFEPTQSLDLVSNWDVLAGQILPPGARFWWEWRLTTADGEIIEVPREQTTFDDGWFVWQSIEREDVTVYWYRGDNGYPTEILEAAIESRETLARDIGFRLEDPVELYLYDEPFDLVRSIPGAPQWAGGVAFPAHNIMMVAANGRSEDAAVYGIRTTRHEFGHLVIGRLTFNCLNGLPTWLNEGLAQIAEGSPDERNIELVAAAVRDDELLTLNQLEGNFSIHSERASLSYAQSDRFSRYLIEIYGPDQMLNLLKAFSVGETIDGALVSTYGKTKRALENEWRLAVDALPVAEIEEPVAESTEADSPTKVTAVPTLALLAVERATEPPTPSPTPTPEPTATPIPPPPTPEPTEINEIALVSEELDQPIDIDTSSESGPISTAESGGSTGNWLYFVIGLVVFVIIGAVGVSIVVKR